ncbi:MAG TPA: complex I NDUFA9 subunit family protein [Rhodanobacteraceae bacterium]|jgi:NADH dehydrogenase|nr:complex I NDUFA9 subunit family protein [Rhodanobacteraceae bacterium]
MNTQPIAVLGGTGFIGGHLLATLAQAGCKVTVLSRNRELGRAINVLPNVRTVSADVYDRAALEKHLAGHAAVINLVGILNETRGDTFTHAHVDLTATAIAACRQVGIRRFHQMSSLNAGERVSKYLKTRGEADAQVRNSGLDWTIYRPSVVYGAGDGLVFRFLKLLQMAPVLPLAQPHAKFAPVWVGDVATAIARCLGDRSSIGKVFELYGPDTLELVEIVHAIRDAAGLKRAVLPLPSLLGHAQALLAELVPGKPFSRDNFASLSLDSVGDQEGLARLGVTPRRFRAMLPDLLGRHSRARQLDLARATQGH